MPGLAFSVDSIAWRVNSAKVRATSYRSVRVRFVASDSAHRDDFGKGATTPEPARNESPCSIAGPQDSRLRLNTQSLALFSHPRATLTGDASGEVETENDALQSRDGGEYLAAGLKRTGLANAMHCRTISTVIC